MRNIVVATAGSAIGGVFVCPWVGITVASSAAFDSRSLVVSLISTLLCLTITNLARDPSARDRQKCDVGEAV